MNHNEKIDELNHLLVLFCDGIDIINGKVILSRVTHFIVLYSFLQNLKVQAKYLMSRDLLTNLQKSIYKMLEGC